MQGRAGHGDFLTRASRPVIPAKSQIDQQYIETEKSEDRPCADGPEKNTDEHPAADQSAHQYGEARTSQRTIGGEESFENGFVEPIRFCAVWVMHSIQVVWQIVPAYTGLRQAADCFVDQETIIETEWKRPKSNRL